MSIITGSGKCTLLIYDGVDVINISNIENSIVDLSDREIVEAFESYTTMDNARHLQTEGFYINPIIKFKNPSPELWSKLNNKNGKICDFYPFGSSYNQFNFQCQIYSIKDLYDKNVYSKSYIEVRLKSINAVIMPVNTYFNYITPLTVPLTSFPNTIINTNSSELVLRIKIMNPYYLITIDCPDGFLVSSDNNNYSNKKSITFQHNVEKQIYFKFAPAVIKQYDDCIRVYNNELQEININCKGLGLVEPILPPDNTPPDL